MLAGPVVDKGLRGVDPGPVRVPSPDAPLEGGAYAKEVRAVDYSLFLYDRQGYRLRPSAGLFDAFAFAKPVIALKTPFIEHYFRELGDIGFLCEDYDALKDRVLAILQSGPGEQYLRQREALLRGRERFSPERLGERLRGALA